MQVLVLDGTSSIDGSILRYLHVRGHDLEVTRTAEEAAHRLRQTGFDCTMLELSTCDDCLGLLEIRQLLRISAVAFITGVPVDSLVAEAEKEGCIEFQCLPALIENLEHYPKPVLLAGRDLPPAVLAATKELELNIASARTLQLAMNLLVDGWCHVVWLHADIPSRPSNDRTMIVHRISAKTLAILASALPNSSPGITCSAKPATAKEWITLLQHIDGNRLTPCGRSGLA